MKKIRPNSLGFKIWIYFMLFTAIILVILWLAQTVFLGNFYHIMKENDVSGMADTIMQKQDDADFEDTIDQLAYDNSSLILVIDQSGEVLYQSDGHGPGAVFQTKSEGGQTVQINKSFSPPIQQHFNELINDLLTSPEETLSYTYEEAGFDGETLVYGAEMGDKILLISTPLDPVDATTDILKSQLVYVTIIALILGVLISYFIARKLAKPITKITTSAEKLAKGDYEVQFEPGDYEEIDQLATTLNYTTKELSKVENLRRELVANISHDLRTPLTMIKAYAELIRDISGDDKEKREKNIKVIIQEADRLSALVNDILELSKMQTDNDEIHLQPINLSETIHNINERFTALVLQEKIKIHVDVAPHLIVSADPAKMERVLYNLIGNAINYVGEDRLVQVNLIDLDDHIRFEVIDSGKGIPKEELELIWDRYYKAKTHKRSVVSNGIGLSIVKNILVQHEIDFGIISDIGKGSTFWFEFPKDT